MNTNLKKYQESYFYTSNKALKWMSFFFIMGIFIGMFGLLSYQKLNAQILKDKIDIVDRYLNESNNNLNITSKKVDGFYLKDSTNTNLEETKNKLDYHGDWVCVNVRNMTFERAMAVCRHEVGHEVFAEYCEQSEENFEKCKDVVQ